MQTMRRIAWVTGVVAAAACGGGSDSTAPPVSADLTCTNPTTAGAAVTCSVTLPETAALKAVVTDHQTCEAPQDKFVFTAPESAELTTNGCFETVGKEVNLWPYDSGTQVTAEFTPGLLDNGSAVRTRGLGAAQVTGQYPQWTISFEDAVGTFTDDYDDFVVTLTVVRQ